MFAQMLCAIRHFYFKATVHLLECRFLPLYPLSIVHVNFRICGKKVFEVFFIETD